LLAPGGHAQFSCKNDNRDVNSRLTSSFSTHPNDDNQTRY
jgi:hypothetical protein